MILFRSDFTCLTWQNFSDTWYKDNRCCPNGLVLGLGRAIGRWYQSSEKNWTQWCIKAMNKYVVLLHIHCFLGEEDWLFRSSNTCYMRLILVKKNHDTNKTFILTQVMFKLLSPLENYNIIRDPEQFQLQIPYLWKYQW